MKSIVGTFFVPPQIGNVGRELEIGRILNFSPNTTDTTDRGTLPGRVVGVPIWVGGYPVWAGGSVVDGDNT